MKNKKFIAPIILALSLITVFFGVGFGTWIFGTHITADTEYVHTKSDDDDDTNVIIDDIAENYYFASDTKASNYYHVYVFPQLFAASFSGKAGTVTVTETVDVHSSTIDDEKSYTGTIKSFVATKGTTDYTFSSSNGTINGESYTFKTSDNSYYYYNGEFFSMTGSGTGSKTISISSSTVKSFTVKLNNNYTYTFTYQTLSIPYGPDGRSTEKYTGFSYASGSGSNDTYYKYESGKFYKWEAGQGKDTWTSVNTFNNASVSSVTLADGSVVTPTSSSITKSSNQITYSSGSYSKNTETSFTIKSYTVTYTNSTSGMTFTKNSEGKYVNGDSWFDPSTNTVYEPASVVVYVDDTTHLTYRPTTTSGIYSATDAQGKVHYYDSSTGTGYYYNDGDFTNPKDYYDWMKSNNKTTYKDDDYGFWGTTTNAGSNSDGSYNKTKTMPSSGTFDSTEYGYMSITAYKQLTTDQYDSIPDVSCTQWVNSNWSVSFCGFTANYEDAYKQYTSMYTGNKAAMYSDATFFDLTQPLKVYDTDGDHNIYLYPLFANGNDNGNTSGSKHYPTLNIRKNGTTNAAYNYDIRPLPSADLTTAWSASSTYKFDYYYTVSSLYVASSSSRNRTYVLNTNATNYYFDFGVLNSSYGQAGGYAEENIVLDNYLDSSMEAGNYYNLYIYISQNIGSNTGTSTDATAVENLMANKNIVNKTNNTYTSYSGVYIKFYLERIYDYKLTGDVSSSFDYTVGKSKNNLNLTLESEPTSETGGYYVYETPEVVFPSMDFDEFAINFGSHYGNILSLDTGYSDQTSLTDETAVHNDRDKVLMDDGTQYKNPEGAPVWYRTDRLTINAYNSDLTSNASGQQLPTIQVDASGVYKFRIRIKYTDGVPSDIKVSGGYLRGLFVEIFNDNPTAEIGSTGFVNHEDYSYRVDAYYGDELSLDTYFYSASDYSSKTKLSAIISNVPSGKEAVLWDHVTKKKIRICADGFYDGDTKSSTFTLDKNYVFFFAKAGTNTDILSAE